MSQGKALKIPDREKPARRIPCETERKGLNPGKVETRQRQGARGRHSEERKGAQVPEGRAGRRPRSLGFQTCACTLHSASPSGVLGG